MALITDYAMILFEINVMTGKLQALIHLVSCVCLGSTHISSTDFQFPAQTCDSADQHPQVAASLISSWIHLWPARSDVRRRRAALRLGVCVCILCFILAKLQWAKLPNFLALCLGHTRSISLDPARCAAPPSHNPPYRQRSTLCELWCIKQIFIFPLMQMLIDAPLPFLSVN